MFEEIIAENFLNLMKNLNLHNQESNKIIDVFQKLSENKHFCTYKKWDHLLIVDFLKRNPKRESFRLRIPIISPHARTSF